MAAGRRSDTQVVLAAVYLALRYYASFTLLGYGFGKLMGSQFTVLDSQLAKPMGEVSGFWLTWYYFGYSHVYATIIALTQISGAVLLCFRRTTLLGALILLPVMVNIVGVDIWVIQFQWGDPAMRNALCVFFSLLVILAFHFGDLYKFLLRRRDDLAVFTQRRPWLLALEIAVVAGMLAYSAGLGYWLANVNNRAPTPIDGAWHVVQVQASRPDLPDWIYFEYNRAYWVEFHYPDGRSETHDFRVNPQDHTLTISKQWLVPGSDIFKGTWDRTGDAMTLSGTWRDGAPVVMTLQRKQMPVKDHQ